jgi:hypothetical protein
MAWSNVDYAMMAGMTRLVATAAALLLALTACSDDSGSGGSGSGSGDAVAWAEKVCKSVEGDVGKLNQTPDIDPSNPAQAKDSLVSYLGTIETALGNMVSGIRDAGDPPVADGKAAVDKLVNTLEGAKTSVGTAKTNLEQAPADDPAALQQAFTKVAQDMEALGDLQDPTKDLESNQQLKTAFDQAPTCKRLDQGSDSTPTS